MGNSRRGMTGRSDRITNIRGGWVFGKRKKKQRNEKRSMAAAITRKKVYEGHLPELSGTGQIGGGGSASDVMGGVFQKNQAATGAKKKKRRGETRHGKSFEKEWCKGRGTR